MEIFLRRLEMRRLVHHGLTTLLFGFAWVAGAGGQQSEAPLPNASSTVLKTQTQLVVVDVVVQSKDGHPIHGLKQDAFRLTEGGVPQTIRHFEEHTASQTAADMPLVPKLPAGTFTDYSPVEPDTTLNILLMDSLNTPTKDQSYVRNQLQEYIKHAVPGRRIAIFGLANHLILLQGFTSDPDTLKDAINHKLIPRYSSLLDDPGGNGVDSEQASDLAPAADLTSANGASAPNAQFAANLQQFEAETAALQTQLRVQYTLDAFNALGHYLAAFPGRKNLIWFSGSFPINVLPDPALANPFAVAHMNQEEFRETSNLLAKAQVAVYPVDARGLATPPSYSASSSGRRYGPNPQAASAALSTFTSSQAAEHTTMDTLADNTGGRAFYNTNALSDAVTKAIDAGSTYYTLTYTPSEHKQDGGYRKIRVDVDGQAGKDLRLSYRQGYYADDAGHHGPGDVSAAVAGSGDVPTTAAAVFQRAAMSRGAPAPQDMLFTVRVLPAALSTESAVAKGNKLGAGVSPKGPFRRYDVDYVALPKTVTLTLQPDGRHAGTLEFLVYVFDVDGNVLNADGATISLDLNEKDYESFTHHAIQMHLEVSAPAKVESFLRIGVHDVPSNRFGVVEVPSSSVNRLAPAVYAAPAKAEGTAKPGATPAQTTTPPKP